MKIGIISDLHGFLPPLEEVVDLLIIAGDVCPVVDHRIERQEAWIRDEYVPWLKDAPAHHKVMVWGNHDFVGQSGAFGHLPSTGVHLLSNSSVDIEGLKVWGTPLSGKYGRWAFMESEETLAGTYVEIPNDTDIVVSHGPPKFYGDQCQNGYYAGSPSLRTRLGELSNVLTVVGHIHEARGIYLTEECGVIVNSAAVDLSYELRPNPYTFVLL